MQIIVEQVPGERANQFTGVGGEIGDPLAFRRELEYERKRAQRAGSSVSVLSCDLEPLFVVHETEEHKTADLQLSEDLSDAILETMRTTDKMYRMNRRDLYMILSDTDEAGARQFIERVSQRVEEFLSAKLTVPKIDALNIRFQIYTYSGHPVDD